MAAEIKHLIGQLEIVTDEEQACLVTRGIVQFIKSRPGDKVDLTDKAIKSCAKLLRSTVNNKMRCLIFSVLAACCSDTDTMKRYLRKDIHQSLMRTLQHLIKTPWGQCGSNAKSREEVLLEQALTLLHKLVSVMDVDKDPGPMEELIKDGVINRLMDLLDDNDSPLFQYSEASRLCLEDLILRKHLVGQITAWDEKEVVEICEKFVRGSSKLSLSCCKSGKQMTHLYDTTCADVDLDVQKEHIDSGVVWHMTHTDIFEKAKEEGGGDAQKLSDASMEQNEWIDIYPVYVEDGGHFWAHIGGPETLTKVDTIQTKLATLPASCREYLRKEPPVGSFVCAVYTGYDYCDGPLYFRGIVLEVNGEIANVFALDYGFRYKVAFQELCYLSGKMNIGGVPPQATLCSLQEIQPCPVSSQCLKSILAILCCILTFKPSVQPFALKGGLQVLYSLCSAPDLSISCMAMAAVSNISILIHMRKKIATTTFQHLFIKRCANIDPRSPDHMQIQLLLTTLGAMKNLLFNYLEARQSFIKQGGVEVVMALAKKADNKNIKSRAAAVIKVLVGSGVYEEQPPAEEETVMSAPVAQKPLDIEREMPSDNGRDNGRVSRDFHRRYSSDRNRSRSRPSLGREASLGRDRLRERRNSSSDEEDILNRSGGRGAASGDDTDGEMIIPSQPGTLAADVKPHVNVIPVDAALADMGNILYYIHERLVKFCNDETHEIRPTLSINKVSANTIQIIICSFLNNGKGGSIFFGVGKNREVFGMKLTRDQKDQFRLGIDRLMTRFIPVVSHRMYDIAYSPVVDAIGHEDATTRKHIPDLYVIEITLEKQTSTVYTLPDGKCYFRYGPNTVLASTQEIRQRAILQEEARYRDEINLLRTELELLRKTKGENSEL